MKSFEFREDQFPDLQQLASEYLYDETDPRSMSYKRILIRPKIRWGRVAAWIGCPVLFGAAALFFMARAGMRPLYQAGVIVLFSAVYLVFTLKPAVICALQIYQRYAPDSLRNKCRFEPSCSQYMILAVKKYGVIRGVVRGVKRLYRCNVRDGGYDYP